MTEKKEKSLRQRFLSAQKADIKKKKPREVSVPTTYGGVADLYPEDHKSLLDYAAKIKKVYLETHVEAMERVSKIDQKFVGASLSLASNPVIEHTMSASAETANRYHLVQLEGYKKIHEICRQKDVDVQVSLKIIERRFIDTEKYWAVVIDLTKPYSSSTDADIFNELFKKEKKAAKAAKPAA